MAIHPYLFFDGRCEEAIEFYKRALGAKVGIIMRFKDNPDRPPPEVVSPSLDEKIMHASLEIAGAAIMMSDGMAKGDTGFKGISLSLTVEKAADVDRYYDALKDGGEVQMAIGKTFFAERFGAVKDKFGVSWMIIAEAPRAPG